MLFKSLTVLAAAAAATVSAQIPDHIIFTSPIGDDLVYEAGSTQTFSWQHSCKYGDSTSKNPAKTELQLFNADDPNAAFFERTILTFDCSKDRGEKEWVVPAYHGDGSNYALKIILVPNGTFSGAFKIIPSSANSTSTTSTLPTSRTTPTNIKPTIVPTTTTTAPANSSGTPPAGGKSAASSLVPALSSAAALAISAIGAMFF